MVLHQLLLADTDTLHDALLYIEQMMAHVDESNMPETVARIEDAVIDLHTILMSCSDTSDAIAFLHEFPELEGLHSCYFYFVFCWSFQSIIFPID